MFPIKKCNVKNSKRQVNNVVPSGTSHQHLNTNDNNSKKSQNNMVSLHKKVDVRQEDSLSISKLHPPRNFPGEVMSPGKDVKKVPKDAYDCVVTCIDKPNCIWVRDTANDDVFTKVFIMANKAAEQQSTALKPWHTDKVYLAQDDDSWY